MTSSFVAPAYGDRSLADVLPAVARALCVDAGLEPPTSLELPEAASYVVFLVDGLGFELLRDAQMQPGLRWVQVAPRGAATSVTLVTWFETMPAGSNRGLVLETDDLEGDVERLRARGLEFPDGIQQQPWGRFVTFADPDGNGLVLQATSARRPTTGVAG